jgi:hypothetical protein
MNKLKQALEYLGLKSIPKEGTREFQGKAIAQVKRASSSTEYVIARWNAELKRHEVIKDFNTSGCII